MIPDLNDPTHAFQEGLGSVEDIDQTMKLGANMISYNLRPI
jgi:hypothetical protein